MKTEFGNDLTSHQFYTTATYYTFHVKSCSDAHVFLSRDPFPDISPTQLQDSGRLVDSNVIEIVLGADHNTMAYIRRGGEQKVRMKDYL